MSLAEFRKTGSLPSLIGALAHFAPVGAPMTDHSWHADAASQPMAVEASV